MKKMSDVFNLPLAYGSIMRIDSDIVKDGDGVEEFDAIVDSINMHDELVSALEEARAYVEEQEYINGYDRIFLHKIDSLLERCK